MTIFYCSHDFCRIPARTGSNQNHDDRTDYDSNQRPVKQ
jgi:hypothetical protein